MVVFGLSGANNEKQKDKKTLKKKLSVQNYLHGMTSRFH